MADASIPQNLIPNDPSLKDLLDLLSKQIMLNLSCHHIGTVQSFDATKQTASATINYKKTYFQFNASTGLYDPVLIDYPILVDCPVVVLGGTNAALTFPITTGDECLVLFNDRDLDKWFQGGTGASVATPRLHSFSDGIILVGLRSLPKVLTNYDSSRAVLRNGSTLVGVGPSLVKIANDTTTLNTLLQNLITTIKAITTTNAVPGSPCAISAASQAALAVIATQIEGLLE